MKLLNTVIRLILKRFKGGRAKMTKEEEPVKSVDKKIGVKIDEADVKESINELINSGRSEEDLWKSGYDKKLSELHPEFSIRVRYLLYLMRKEGWRAKIVQGYRTQKEQTKILKEGHSKVKVSFHMALLERKPAALAVDIIDERYGWEVGWEHPFWAALGKYVRSLGFYWGGDWDNDGIVVWKDEDESFTDVAHVQFLENSKLKDLRDSIPRVGKKIEDVQKALSNLGLDVGWIDGVVGEKTRSGLKKLISNWDVSMSHI